MSEHLTVICGDALTELRKLPNESAQMCVTSPPFWGLRDYGACACGSGRFDLGQGEGTGGKLNYRPAQTFKPECVKCGGTGRITGTERQLGIEATPQEYVAAIVAVFQEVRRVLKPDATCWLNLGDTYFGSWGNYVAEGSTSAKALDKRRKDRYGVLKPPMADRSGQSGLKPKDLCGIPWMVAFALRAAGWWLRQDIIWNKPNPMPESVTDRCTKSHEYIFLLSKSEHYFYNQEAIKERIRDTSAARLIQDVENQEGSGRVPGKTNGKMKAVRFGGNKQCPDTRLQSGKEWTPKMAGGGTSYRNGNSGDFDKDGKPLCGVLCNKKSVWTVTTRGYKEAHFATFPASLIAPCILAGSRPGDSVLDPFAGSGTTGQVALELGRRAILIELNPEYCRLIEQRCDITLGLALDNNAGISSPTTYNPQRL